MTSPALQTEGLTKRYGRRVALSDCTLAIPPGRVVGLVGPNGAGKTTLLHIAVGLLPPTAGSIEVLGERPASGAAQLARVGFVAQDTPTYTGLSVADHLRFGAHTTPAGISSWPMTGSPSSASTQIRRPGGSPADNAPSSR
jgi:ABC-2 type transport system ATP-binding protein